MLTIQLLSLLVLGWSVTIGHGSTEVEEADGTVPEVCPRDAHYTDCGRHNCNGHMTCAKPVRNNKECMMSRFCIPGCVCNTGYLMNSQDLCVRPNRCDVRPPCETNEVFTYCPRSEDRTCADVIDAIYPLRLRYCAPSCRCLPGYVRDHNNSCVLPRTCLDFWRRN